MEIYTKCDNKETYSHRDEKRTVRECLSRVFDLLSYSKEESAITDGLCELRTFFDADRIYLGIIHAEAARVSFVHETYVESVGGVKDFFDKHFSSHLNLTEAQLPWWFSQLKTGKDIVINDIETIPVENSSCRELICKNNVRSLLCVPTYYRGNINGFLSIECVRQQRQWSSADSENLHVLAKYFSYIIEQEKTRDEINISAMRAMQNEVLLQMIIENIPVGIELYDKDGYLIDINPAGLDILETTSEKVLGVNLFENPTISEDSKKCIRRGENAHFENQYNFNLINESGYFQSKANVPYKSLIGKNVPLKDTCKSVFGYLQLVYDNTEAYLQHKLIQNNLTKLKLAIDTGKSFIWEYDVEADKINVDYSLVSESKIWGNRLKKDRIKPGSSYRDHYNLVHPEDIDRVYNQGILPMLQGKKEKFTSTYRQWVENKYHWLTTNFHAYQHNSDGKPIRIMCYTTNVTEQYEMEMELIRVKETDNLKSAFIDNISHEIRTPLNAIIGLSSFLADNFASIENQELADCIQSNSEQLLHIMDGMLYYTQLETGTAEYTYETTDIKIICESVIEKFLPKVSPKVSLVFDPSHPSFLLYTDRKKLKEVLLQLVDNAVKFTYEGYIKLTYEIMDNHILRFTLADTGIGMTPKEQEKLFYPFYKVDTFRQGIGLGLAICKWITKSLGGDIRVKSIYGKGSLFQIDLPIKDR